jgi:hypothetical protein
MKPRRFLNIATSVSCSLYVNVIMKDLTLAASFLLLLNIGKLLALRKCDNERPDPCGTCGMRKCDNERPDPQARRPAQAGLLALADEMRTRGATVLLAAPAGTPNCDLRIIETASIDLDPISMTQSFYPMVEALSRARGFDPDRPRYLAKVTRTQ